VRRTGEHGSLRVDQSLNFFRGVIEAPRQLGDLVAALVM
jgi:hypothetical protein